MTVRVSPVARGGIGNENDPFSGRLRPGQLLPTFESGRIIYRTEENLIYLVTIYHAARLLDFDAD